MNNTKMQLTTDFGSDWWNDSCDLKELQDAVDQGAVGATSNPVIIKMVVESKPDEWLPVIDRLISESPNATEDDITWALVDDIGTRAAKILKPVYDKTNGEKGKLSLQVNPKQYPNPERMVEQAKHLAGLAPNVAIKCPAIGPGLEAIEELISQGITINATVSFSVPQAVSCAEAVERGCKRAEENGVDTSNLSPYVTIMVGRIDDHLRGIMKDESITIDPDYLDWAGVAIFKRAYKIFKERGYRSKLLSAAFRCHMHWSEMVGGNVVISMPYDWWNKFNDSDIEVKERMDKDVDKKIIDQLQEKFVDFGRAYEEDGMKVEEFLKFGPSVRTLSQFLGGYDGLVGIVRERMLST